MNVKADELAGAVMKLLKEQAEISANAMRAAVDEAAVTVKNDIKKTAPKASGAYARSWKISVKADKAHVKHVVVHSEKHYRLTHLLEYGHAKRGGGRTRAFPHIADAEEHGRQVLLERLEKTL